MGTCLLNHYLQRSFPLRPGPPEEVEVHSFPMPFAVLGRDILNQYHITLDGPNLTLTVTR